MWEMCALLNVRAGGQEYGELEVHHNLDLTEIIKCIPYEFDQEVLWIAEYLAVVKRIPLAIRNLKPGILKVSSQYVVRTTTDF